MLCRICSALWVVTIVAVLGTVTYGAESVSIWNHLAQRAAGMAAEVPPVPDSVDSWEKHRAELVQELEMVLGLPDREPMKAAVTDTKEDGDLVFEEVVYLWAERAYVSATVIHGKQTDGRRPAIVLTSGWLGHYTFLPYRAFVDSMARQGFLVLFIDDPRAGKRQSPYAGLYATASAAGTQVSGIQVFDALRGLDYLLTRPDVDPERIGIAGMGQGALLAYTAAALEPRFQFVVAVGGTTTYAALAQAAAEAKKPEDPSAYVAGILRFTDMDRVAACIAPRPILVAGGTGNGRWPAAGYSRMLRTMKAVYGLYRAADRIDEVPGEQAENMSPYIPDITRFVVDVVRVPSVDSAGSTHAPRVATAPLPCGKPDNPDFSMLRYLQRRIANRAESLPAPPDSEAAWHESRQRVVEWLHKSYGPDNKTPTADTVIDLSESGNLVTEQLVLGVDADFRCPATLVRPSESGQAGRAGVVLSHEGPEAAASARIVDAARRLATAGYWVIVPDHASSHPQSRQPLALAGQPRSFYRDEAARLYGPADAVGLPPLALRVAEDLAAFRHLAGRGEIDPQKIIVAGQGTGSVDACLAAVLENRIAGVAAVDATTIRDWAVSAAPGELRFFHIMPYLPSMLETTDLDFLYAAIAPRPLLAARLKGGWPGSGFDQVVTATSAVYKLSQAEGALLVLGPRDVAEKLEAGTPEGIRKQLLAAAQTLLPTPPQPGVVGTPDGLKSRRVVDSASGLIWIVAEMNGHDQEFMDGGYELRTWSFFNDNADAQKGRVITPLVFKREGDKYQLTAIGKTRTNAGTGLQQFPFESVAGDVKLGAGHFFGWFTGDLHGNHNPGVAEFEDAPDALMIILTADGQLGGQKLKIGDGYRAQSQYRRRYSVVAVSKKL